MGIEHFKPVSGCHACATLKAQYDAAAARASRAQEVFDRALGDRNRVQAETAATELSEAVVDRHLAEVTIVRHLDQHLAPR